MISRHASVKAALADAETFLPDNVLETLIEPSWETLRELGRAGFNLAPTLANNGTASHPGLRRLVSRFVTGPALGPAKVRIEALAAAALDGLEERFDAEGSADIMELVAQSVPSRMILEVLGFGGLEPKILARWTYASLELFWGLPTSRRQTELAREVAEFYRWIAAQVARGAGAAEGPFIRALWAHRKPDGRSLTRAELAGVGYFMTIAGHVTVSQMLATAFLRLIAIPEVWAQLGTGPDAAGPWVEELLRRDTPLSSWRRVTSKAVTVEGVTIPPRAHVLLLLGASGLDSEVFADPLGLCPGRANISAHLAFGSGKHRCAGASFARMEIATILSATARRFPRMELVEPSPPYWSFVSFRSPRRVLVRRC